jgi:DNA polymerase III subunit delta
MYTDSPETDYHRVLDEIRKGKIHPVYLLHGEEEYLLSEALEEMVAGIIPEADRELNLFTLAGGPDEADRLASTLVLPPLLSGRKLVVVRDTHLFHSKQTLGTLIKSIREQVDKNPPKAAAAFLTFLDMAGWKLEDLRDGGWKTITDEDWNRLVDGDGKDERGTWLPRVIDLCLVEVGGKKTTGKDEQHLEELLRHRIPPENHLILVAEAVDRRKKLFKVISEVGVVLHFPKVKTEQKQKERLMDQVQGMLAKQGKKMTSEAWETLGRKTGFQLRESIQAVEKLMIFAGDKKTIDETDVEAVVGKSKEDSVFQLTAAVTEKNLSGSLNVLQELILQGVPYLMILAMLSREIRHLLQAKLLLRSGMLQGYRFDMDYGEFQRKIHPLLKDLTARGGKKEMGLISQHPFAVYQSLKSSRRFTDEALLLHLDQLVQIDILLKSTGRDERLMLERFLVAVCAK